MSATAKRKKKFFALNDGMDEDLIICVNAGRKESYNYWITKTKKR